VLERREQSVGQRIQEYRCGGGGWGWGV